VLQLTDFNYHQLISGSEQLNMKNALANVGDRRKNHLIDQAILRIAVSDTSGPLTTSEINNLILQINGKVGLLRDKAKRAVITDAFSKKDAMRLSNFLGLENHSDPWIQLRNQNIRKNSKMENNLFSWFQISEADLPAPIIVNIPPTVEHIQGNHGLFLHQRTAIQQVRIHLDSNQPRTFLHMPTGSGKTRTAMNYICETLALRPKGLVVWFAFNGELCEQAAKEFMKAWSFHGNREVSMQRMWGAHTVDEVTEDGILLVGLDKLWAKIRQDNVWLYNLAHRVDLLVFDEAHQSTAETYQHMVEILLDGNSTKLLGLSATPGRTYNDPLEDQKLSKLYYRQKVTLEVEGYSSPLDYLVDENYLSKPVFHQMPFMNQGLTEREKQHLFDADEYPESLLEKLSDDEKRNLLILDRVKMLVNEGHKRILVFANSVRHSDILNTYTGLRTNISCASITGKTDSDMRQKWLESFKDITDDEPCVLFNYGVLTTGFDAPRTSAAIISRPTKSLVLYSQMVGRVIRGTKVEGTESAEIWTVVDQGLPGFRDLSEAFTNWEDVWD
jgi:DNA repair protein RadD